MGPADGTKDKQLWGYIVGVFSWYVKNNRTTSHPTLHRVDMSPERLRTAKSPRVRPTPAFSLDVDYLDRKSTPLPPDLCSDRFTLCLSTNFSECMHLLRHQGQGYQCKYAFGGRDSARLGSLSPRSAAACPPAVKNRNGFVKRGSTREKVKKMAPSPMAMVSAAANVAIALALVPKEETENLRMTNHANRSLTLGNNVGGFESSATGGKLFTMEKIRTYEGPTIDFDTSPSFPFRRPPDDEMCERWAVLTSIFEPTATVLQLAKLSGWCVVVVGDKNGEATHVSVFSCCCRTPLFFHHRFNTRYCTTCSYSKTLFAPSALGLLLVL